MLITDSVLPVPEARLEHPLAPGEDLRGFCWFDHESDGPYDLAEAEETIVYDPVRRGREFHITGRPHLSYDRLLPERFALLHERHQEHQAAKRVRRG